MRNSWRLGKLGSVEFRLDYSWFLVFTLAGWSLAVHEFPARYPWPASTCWMVAAAVVVLLFASIVVHELAHTLAAARRGLMTRSTTLFVFGGIAATRKRAETPVDELLIAMSGVAVSATIGVLSGAASFLLPERSHPAAALLEWLSKVNVAVAGLNLLPGFPLDGGRVVRSYLWKRLGNFQRASRFTAGTGQLIAYGLIAVGLWTLISGDSVFGLWLTLLGWLISNAAASSYQQLLLREQLAGFAARDVMASCPRVRRDLSLWDLVHNYFLTGPRRCLAVADNGCLLGIVTLSDVAAVPQRRWPEVRISEVMTEFEDTVRVPPDLDLFSVMELMIVRDINQVPVVEDHRLLGLVSRDRVLSFLAARSELGLEDREPGPGAPHAPAVAA